MAKSMSRKKALASAEKIMKSMFPTPAKCSKAGAKLAKDSSGSDTKSKAGSTLGSLTCKVPARRGKFTR